MTNKPPKISQTDFWVVVPFYNEEKLILDNLNALKAQDDSDFTLVYVDNSSTDQSPQMVKDYITKNPDMNIHVIVEKLKGTGAASDTGFRYAIKHGAKIIARTDADALPCTNWVSLFKSDFADGVRFLGGRITPRTDEPNYKWYDKHIYNFIIAIMEWAPAIFYHRPGQKYRMFMVPGLNMAIDAELYTEVGGFPRSSIDDTDEDLELHLKVCQTIDGSQARLNKQALVYGSIRKAKTMGYIGIILWYWGRKYKAESIDIR